MKQVAVIPYQPASLDNNLPNHSQKHIVAFLSI